MKIPFSYVVRNLAARRLTTALTAGLPELTDGWSYRTFRLITPVSGAAKGFLRADITAAP